MQKPITEIQKDLATQTNLWDVWFEINTAGLKTLDDKLETVCEFIKIMENHFLSSKGFLFHASVTNEHKLRCFIETTGICCGNKVADYIKSIIDIHSKIRCFTVKSIRKFNQFEKTEINRLKTFTDTAKIEDNAKGNII